MYDFEMALNYYTQELYRSSRCTNFWKDVIFEIYTFWGKHKYQSLRKRKKKRIFQDVLCKVKIEKVKVKFMYERFYFLFSNQDMNLIFSLHFFLYLMGKKDPVWHSLSFFLPFILVDEILMHIHFMEEIFIHIILTE